MWRDKFDGQRNTCEGTQDRPHYQCQNQGARAALPIAENAKSLLVEGDYSSF